MSRDARTISVKLRSRLSSGGTDPPEDDLRAESARGHAAPGDGQSGEVLARSERRPLPHSLVRLERESLPGLAREEELPVPRDRDRAAAALEDDSRPARDLEGVGRRAPLLVGRDQGDPARGDGRDREELALPVPGEP